MEQSRVVSRTPRRRLVVKQPDPTLYEQGSHAPNEAKAEENRGAEMPDQGAQAAGLRRISVTMLSGEEVASFSLRASASIRSLQQQLAERTGHSIYLQRLLHGTRSLKADQTLESARLADGSGLSLIILSDPLQDISNLDLLRPLRDLKHRWNSLGLADDGERRELLALMSRVIRTGKSTYQNPFGGDDTEYFLDAFEELPDHERRLFWTVARECAQGQTGFIVEPMNSHDDDDEEVSLHLIPAIGRCLTEDDIRGILMAPRAPPFFC